MAKTYSQSKLIKGVHSGEFSKYRLPTDLFEFTYNELVREVEKVFTDRVMSDDGDRQEIVKKLKTNIAHFSGAKTFTEVNEISRFLFDSDGFKLPFKAFEEIVKPIDDKYNKVWIKTEQDTAFGQSQMADNWIDYEADKDIFPYLKYQTAADERVRHEHAAWDNKVFPVDHPFWDTRTPLNGYNCRCRVIQLRDGRVSSTRDLQKNTEKVFANNAGKTGKVFTDKHPYFKTPKKDLPLTKNNYGLGGPETGFKPAKTLKEAKDSLKNTFEKTGLKAGRVTIARDMPLDKINRYTQQLNNLVNEYKLSEGIRTDDATNILYRSTKSYYGAISSRISSVNGRKITQANFGNITDQVRGGVGILGKSRVDDINLDLATITHEFAHLVTITNQKTTGSKQNLDFWNGIGTIRNEYYKEMNATSKREDRIALHLGRYAGQDADEFLAEAFTEYKLKTQPSKYAQKVGVLFDKFFKK